MSRALSKLNTGSATANDALLACAGVEPQQIQSAISCNSKRRAAQTESVDFLKSQAVDSRLQPGKKAYFTDFFPPHPLSEISL